jgi:alcohol dehydrogenase
LLIDFLSPPRVLFGAGCSNRLGEEARRFGNRALVVTGRHSLIWSENLARITVPLQEAAIETIFFNEVDPEPAVTVVDRVRQLARDEQCTMLIGVGGGSVLDVTKAAAGLFNESGSTGDYHAGQPITQPGLPWIAVPTTAGSGSESTSNSVLIDPKTGLKASVRHELWIAKAAIVDPIFTMSMSPALTAQTGMDALTHAIEAYTSRWANPYSDALSQRAALLIMQNIFTSYSGRDLAAKERMLLGSYLAGVALNQVRAGAVHALAHSVGARYNLAHGLVCGVLLPYVMEYNLPRALEKYADLAYQTRIASPDHSEAEAADRLIKYVHRLKEKIGLPEKLKDLGLIEADLQELVNATASAAALDSNPRIVKRENLKDILSQNL